MSTFVFELGVEELPPAYVTQYAQTFAGIVAQLAKEQALSITADMLTLIAAPRRLGFLLELTEQNRQQQLTADTQKGEYIEQGVLIANRMGPKVQSLSDKPAVGFAKSCGIEAEELQQDEQGRVFCQVRIEPKKALELIPGIIQSAFEQFNKTVGMRFMRWSDKDELFIRPVKWILLLNDADVIPMNWLGLTSERYTRGHRFHGVDSVEVQNAIEYSSLMKEQRVMPNYQARKEAIISQLKHIEADTKATVVMDEDLLDEVTSINEWPTAVLCHFNQAFLEVPQEALIESMQSHQKSFALTDGKGALLPQFITIANIESKQPESLINGNEKVMSARLSDAQFFYENDVRQSLKDMNQKNSTVTFQKKLGTIADKTQRVKTVVNAVAETISANQVIAQEAAEYANADLRSSMVYEFTELQGIMGKYYYRKNSTHDNQDDVSRIADAIEQRYWPRFSDDAIPQTKEAACLAIADRVDTLIGIFGIGMKPTGSKDPYSLRRAAIGLIRIIQEQQLSLSLSEILTTSFNTFSEVELNETVVSEVHDYILKRLEDLYLKEYSDDKQALHILRAVLACQRDDLVDLQQRFNALREFKDLPELSQLAEANKRVKNLLKKVAQNELAAINTALLQEPAEKQLAACLDTVKQEVRDKQQYVDKFKVLCEFAQPLSTFFDEVMVMSDDNNIKINRLSLLNTIYSLFLDIADISFIS